MPIALRPRTSEWLFGASFVLVAACAIAGCGDDGASYVPDLAAPAGSAGSGAVGAGGASGGAGGSIGGASGGAGASGGGPSEDAPSTTSGVNPSRGAGGSIRPGQVGGTPLGAGIRIPSTYTALSASPVVWLFNEQFESWSSIADADQVVLVDLAEYNDIAAINAKLEESQAILERDYNVDRARYYWAGWSAGGNIAVFGGAQTQDVLAGTMVFPGSGGSIAQPHMESRSGHKIRLFYACGENDPNYPWTGVRSEADYWKRFGYETAFVSVPNAGHFLDEAATGIRAKAWQWIRGFNLEN